MVAAAAARDDRTMTQANLDWHYRIYRAARNAVCAAQIFELWIPYGWSNIWHEELRAAAIRQHEEIHECDRGPRCRTRRPAHVRAHPLGDESRALGEPAESAKPAGETA